MSMWSESLSLCFYDWGDNVAKRAKCILSHLAMPVPRSWWELALEKGYVPDTFANILCDLREELSAALDRDEPLSLGLLVAMAFIDDDRTESRADCFSGFGSRHTPDEYLARAREILAERPELVQLGAMLEQAAVKRPSKPGSDTDQNSSPLS